MKIEGKHNREWVRFAVSTTSMILLAAFTLWRAALTAWRPLSERSYFFPKNTWLGVVDRSWFNDFLLGPGTAACSFVAFTLLYAAGGLLSSNERSILDTPGVPNNDSAWADHARLMRIILYGLLVRALLEAWAEEVGFLGSPLVFDPWDLTVELGGIVLGAWVVHSLPYPLFSRVPHFAPGVDAIPKPGALWTNLSVDVASVIATGFYIVIVDPFELRPLSLGERQLLALEVALVFVTFRMGLKRGMHAGSDRPPSITAQRPLAEA